MTELLKTKQVASMLNISPPKVRKLAAEGKLNGTRAFGDWLFIKSEIEEIVERVFKSPIKKEMGAV